MTWEPCESRVSADRSRDLPRGAISPSVCESCYETESGTDLQRLVDADFDLRSDGDSSMSDDTARTLSAMVDKVEGSLRHAVADTDRASVLAGQLIEENLRVGLLPSL